MDTQTRVEQFLDLEATAQRLLDELNELRRETESYSTAGTALTDSINHIDILSDRLGSVAGEVENAAVSLREIGTPQLLERQDKIQAQLGELAVHLGELKDGTAAILQALDENRSTTLRTVSEMSGLIEANQQSLSQHTTTTIASVEDLQAEAASGRHALSDDIQVLTRTAELLRQRIDDAETSLSRQTRTLQILVIALSVVATVSVLAAIVWA